VTLPAALALLWVAWGALDRARLEAAATARLAAEMRRREEAESALLQRHKMEAIGQLTGGIAHDFNNLLTVICGNLERLEGTALDARQLQMAGAAERAAHRAAGLAHQLLAFSRRQALKPETFFLQDRIEGTLELLERSLPATIGLALEIAPDTGSIHADWAQLELALLNIAVNARDAMPAGGRLTIAAAHAADVPADVKPAGGFVAITVTDTGSGMPPEVKARVFEPFFTTKEVGRGTGLGLSQVYGFTQQSGGTTTIESVPGAGTAVTLYLPRPPAAARAAESRNRVEVPAL
jgi:two-component system NtrC family sensor kinase